VTEPLTLRERINVIVRGRIPDRLIPPKASVLPPRTRTIGTFNGMTLPMWKRSNEHIKWAQEVFKVEKFRDMLAVISNTRPVPTTDPNQIVAAIELGRRRGHDDILRVILDLPLFPEHQTPVLEADYSASEVVETLGKAGYEDQALSDDEMIE
jgi:hypothetical protein